MQNRIARHARALTPLLLATACGGSEEPVPEFQYSGEDLVAAATGTYEGTLTTSAGAQSPMVLTVMHEPDASQAAQALKLQPQCGTVSRDVSETAASTGALELQCATLYETTLTITGTATSDAFDGSFDGTLIALGLELDQGDWTLVLTLDDGDELFAVGRKPLVGHWARNGSTLGEFQLTKR